MAPRAVERNSQPPPVLIEEFRVDGVRRELFIHANQSSTPPGEHWQELRIEPGRHYVEMHFAGINFTAADLVRFRWRLEGAEPQWREAVNQRVAKLWSVAARGLHLSRASGQQRRDLE